MSERRYCLRLAYDGSRFHGWQVQPGLRTVAGELGSAVDRLTREQPRIQAAGRTDRGAHAHGQLAALTLSRAAWPPAELGAALNALLPEDMTVLEVGQVPTDFDPRRQAWRRTYRYLVRDSWERLLLGREREWWVAASLELEPMREGTRALLGRRDFAGFGASPWPGGSTVRLVDRATITREQGLVCLEVRADAFLRGMMRNFAGALVALGRGRAELAQLLAALGAPASGARPWQMAPARGLHQWRVELTPVRGGAW